LAIYVKERTLISAQLPPVWTSEFRMHQNACLAMAFIPNPAGKMYNNAPRDPGVREGREGRKRSRREDREG